MVVNSSLEALEKGKMGLKRKWKSILQAGKKEEQMSGGTQ